MHRFLVVVWLAILHPGVFFAQTVISFDALPDGTPVTTQYSGLVFTNAAIARSGVSLNELEFPPRSGANVVFDSAGAMTIAFSPAVSRFIAYFNYRVPITIQAFDSNSLAVGTATSAFSSNLVITGSPGSSPNEFLQVTAAAGITRVTITGDVAGASFTMDDAATVALSNYLVGDSFPSTANSVGNFGDGSLNNFDLIATLRAVTLIPGARPPACSDLYDAMDAFPTDTLTVRGGDGSLDNFDLIATLRRVTSLDLTLPLRTSRGLPCPDAPLEVPGPIAGTLEFGQARGGRIPVYLRGGAEVSSLSFGLGSGRTALRFIAAEGLPPQLVDSALPGKLAVSWLESLRFPARDVLLGYIEGAGASAIEVYGVVANATDGRRLRVEHRTEP